MSRHDVTLAATRAAHLETKDLRFLDAALAIQRLGEDVKAAEGEIADAWDAFGTRVERGTTSLQEQIASLLRETHELEDLRRRHTEADRVIAAIERLVPDFTSHRDLAAAVEAALRVRRSAQ